MKCIRVGDPHVTIPNIKDCELLIDFIIEKAQDYQVDRIEFMGDLFHTHAVKRLEVEQFWYRAFRKITNAQFEILSLVGNHDQMGKGSEGFSSLDTLSHIDGVTIVYKPIVKDNITYVGYHRNNEELVKECNLFPNKCLIAHTTFTGATYENGFYAEDGIDPALFDFDEIISGHIHKQQQVGKCLYIGTPKWDTLSDANQDKGIWFFEHNSDGSVKTKEFISTELVVTPIMKYVVNEGEELPKLKSGFKNYIELVGKSSWIKKTKTKIKGLAQIKARPTDRLSSTKISSSGDSISIDEYLDKYFELVNGVDKKSVSAYINNIEV